MVNLIRIKLVNFIGIYLGTEKTVTEFELDRSKSSNNIILILGDNGSGKSSLINELTPLPLEHMGARNSSRIIPDKIGVKELDYLVDNYILYKIKIVYDPKKTTKCYITKIVDDKEIDLNPNGNVDSYLEVIENELHMKKNYTNVGYLCGNGKSKNFVSMKPTERNNYISEWMPEISEFLDAYKISAKIMSKLKKDIDNYNKQIGNMSSINYELELNYVNANLENLNKSLKELEKTITELKAYNSQLEKYRRSEQHLNDLKYKFKEAVNNVNRRKSEFAIKWSGIELPDTSNMQEFNAKKENYHVQLNEIMSKLDYVEETMNILSSDISTSRSMLSTDSRISGMDLNMLYNNIDSNKKILENINSSINNICENYSSTIEELKMTPIDISNINSIINIIDDRFIQLNNLVSLDIIKDMDHIDKSINDKTERMQTLDKMITDTTNKLTIINNQIYAYENSNIDSKILMKRPEFCIDHKCGIVEELLKYLNPKDNLQELYAESKKLEKQRIDLQSQKEEISEALKNYKNSMQIYLEITDFLYKNNEKIANFPTPIREFFCKDPSTVYIHINEIKAIVAELTEFSSLLIKKDEIEKSNNDLESVKTLVFTNSKLDAKIKESAAKYESLKIQKDDLTRDYEVLSKQCEVYDNATEMIDSYCKEQEEINNEIVKLNNVKRYLSQLNEVNYYLSSNDHYLETVLNKRELELQKDIMAMNSKRDEMTTFYVSKRQIETMRNELQTEFNKVNILNKIWSPKVGYPSMKIDSFLSDLTIKTNEDLSNMWGADNLKIKDFQINASDFNIVVIKDGLEIEDAGLCSSGQMETINTAISFSIIESAIGNNGYDVLRLDEIDGCFDETRRLGFMEMMQRRTDEMGVDSCFIITHNNCFDDIPCDLVLLNGAKISENQMKNKNVLFDYSKI